ncbi:MAG TPA: tRNA preQ1(34) S-adenosylmethionine ribosyltransferase-isomerase QueA [Polyangiaceae bacterium]
MTDAASFDYELPEALIAQRPADRREAARLLVLQPERLEHRVISDLAQLVPADALLVMNSTRVRRARLLGQRARTAGRVELLLLEPVLGTQRWRALGKANRPLKPGDEIVVGDLRIVVEEKHDEGVLMLRLACSEPLESALAKDGLLPLPPYIRRAPDGADDDRYQTVFARELGSVAAPTAGLHLSRELLAQLEARGVELGYLTLHVGVGTFRPLSAERLEDHVMHEERIEVGAELAEQVLRARAAGRPVVAVGTTVVRTLESVLALAGEMREYSGSTRLFITPGYQFRVVDALLTNFHMPRSTLLALVAAFAGYDLTMNGYRTAVAEGYRFLSYGDAMWIPRCHGRTI